MEATFAVALLLIARLAVPFGLVMLISSIIQRRVDYQLH